jgi:uncharacterized protein
MSTVVNIPSQDDKNVAILMHIGGIFFNFIPSLIVYIFLSDKSKWLKEEAKDALNFEISFLIYFFVASALMVILIGFLILPILVIFNWVCSILAIMALNGGKKYNFPFTISFLK